MKKIKLKSRSWHMSDFSDDINRIVKVMNDAGYECSAMEAAWLWEQSSEALAAGWLALPASDKDLLEDISYYFEAIDEG